jgi:hypothetical protein
MAQNVFDATFDANNQINVASYDWQHVNNLTTTFGRITPVFCELVPAKGSVRINPEFGLELMPMIFPVQTRMFARINFFKVRLRSLWSDYMDFVGNFRDDLEEPYLLPDETRFDLMHKTGTLGDYLNLPTKAISSEGLGFTRSNCMNGNASTPTVFKKTFDEVVSQIQAGTPDSGGSCTNALVSDDVFFIKWIGSVPDLSSDYSFNVSVTIGASTSMPFLNAPLSAVFFSGTSCIGTVSNIVPSVDGRTITFRAQSPGILNDGEPISVYIVSQLNQSSSANLWTFNQADMFGYNTEPQEVKYSTYPFATETHPDYERLLAYRPRAYECVYNAYYRDIRNNPFIVDGKPVYNRWLPNYAGGADKTPYQLHYCNWERDFLTTAVPNPQQGQQAPLAGLTTYDSVTANEDGTYTVRKATALVTEDGKKYGLNYKVSEDDEVLESVDYEALDDKTPVYTVNSAIQLAQSGLAIETLRYVNAYQKFLELNMRKGFSYKQIMQGRWDINIRFDELLMPEFIGGVSRELTMNTISQTVDQQSSTSQGKYAEALGSKTGIAGVYGNSSSNIEVFCDEECLILGLLTVTPVPIYSQMLPKDWTYNGLLDHYQPEFDRIGFQPITYKEICPMNAVGSNPAEQLNKIFGYQRPWYEYVAKYDTAHGSFRDSMSGFLMQRFFTNFPELGKQFLLVDPDTVNNVFSVTEYTDKIFGYVKFNCVSRLPISRVAIPRLD